MADIKLGASALGGFYLGSVSVDKVYLGNAEIFSESEPFDSGILQNGTFSDSSGVNIPSGGWEVAGGTLDYLTGGAKKVRLTLSSNMIVGKTYNITFTLSNASNARMAWYAGNQEELIEGNTDRGDGTYTISGYTHTVADRGEISIVAQTSGGGTTFSIDNISVLSTDVYPWDNAVGPNDIDSNDGWSNTSTFFANSIASTDAGQNFSIAIEARSTSTSNTGYMSNSLNNLTVGTPYKATIRYKNTSTTTPVQHPMNSWREVSDVTYPSGTFSTGQWVEAEVLFTPNDPVNDAEMRFYPLANASGGRTLGDTLEISSIIIEEVAATDAILDASPVGYFTPESIVDSGGAVSEWTDVVNGHNFVTNLGSPSKVLDGGVDAVLFDGVDDMMQTSDTSHFDFNPTVDEFSIVMKISGAASSNNTMLHRGSASSANASTYQYAAAFRTDRQIVSVGGAGSTNFSSPRATGTDDLIIITVSTTTVTVRINGTDVYTFAPSSNNFDTLTSIGGRNSSNLAYASVTFQRLAFFDKVLSAGEITAIEAEF